MNAKIQFQDSSGNWWTVSIVKNTEAFIKRSLDQAEKAYKTRVRAIDASGNIIDLRHVK